MKRESKMEIVGLVLIPLVLLALINQVRPRELYIGVFPIKDYEKTQSVGLKQLLKLTQEHRFSRRFNVRWTLRHETKNNEVQQIVYERTSQILRYSTVYRSQYVNWDCKSTCSSVTIEEITKATMKNDFSGLLFGDGCVDNFPKPSY